MNQTSENIPHPSFTSRVFVGGDGLKKQKQGSRKIALTYLQRSKLVVINNPVAPFLIIQSIFFLLPQRGFTFSRPACYQRDLRSSSISQQVSLFGEYYVNV